ncbi:MAG: hypothetical protein K2Q22_04645, partial [Cytophagales bacterium]|nr:hypothetical protein [Cytophagales bacterium]
MANPIKELLRRTKLSYMMYNVFHPSLLKHNLPVFKKYGIHKKYFYPIGNQDFNHLKSVEKPWLDVQNSRLALPGNPVFARLSPQIQEELLPWSDQGYAVLKKFFDEKEVDTIWQETEDLVKSGKANWRYNHSKIMFAVNQSSKLRKTASPARL